jgi:predicted nucleic acid-binding protein
VKYFIESSVLIAAAIPSHENNRLAVRLLLDCKAEGELVCLSTHVLAEMYSTITKLGRKSNPQYSLKGIVNLIRRTVQEMSTIILVKEHYYAAMDRCAEHDLVSGVIYDALHYQAALKAKADFLYTENRRDFDRLHQEKDKLIIRSLSQ